MRWIGVDRLAKQLPGQRALVEIASGDKHKLDAPPFHPCHTAESEAVRLTLGHDQVTVTAVTSSMAALTILDSDYKIDLVLTEGDPITRHRGRGDRE